MKRYNTCHLLVTLMVMISIQTSYAQISLEESPALRVGDSTRYSAITTHKIYQQSVHEDFNRHDFEKAFEGYSLLAMFNDKVAQYRLAFMYSHGLGVKKNLIQAYAWSQLSKESQPIDQDSFHETYVNLYEHIVKQLDDSQREQAEILATEYYSKYSLFAVAQRVQSRIRKAKTKCTGSLLGICNRSSLVLLRNASCNLDNNSKPGTTCLSYASVGLAGVSGLSNTELNKHLRQLDQIIERYNPGRVELRDLETIDEPTISERS